MGRISFGPLEEQLKKSGLTRYSLTRYFHISKSTLSRISHGEESGEGAELSLYTVARLCCALGCQPGDIIEYIPDEEDEKAAGIRRKAIAKRVHWTDEEIAAENSPYLSSRAGKHGVLLRDAGPEENEAPRRDAETAEKEALSRRAGPEEEEAPRRDAGTKKNG